MSIALDPSEHRSASLESSIQPSAPWRVQTARALQDFRVQVRFIDGLEGIVDLKRMIFSPEAGVFASLRDPSVFAQADVVLGVLTWPGELDLAPDAMHDEITARGEWVLE